jgi:hypothetical protein
MSNLGQVANIVKSLILQQAWIFGEEAAEEEAVQEAAEEETTATEVEARAEQPNSQKDPPVGLGLDTDVPEVLNRPIDSVSTPISPVGAVVKFDGEEEVAVPETPLEEVEQPALFPTPPADKITFSASPNGLDDSTIRASSTPRSDMPSPSQRFENDAADGLSLEFSVKIPPPPPLIPPLKSGEAFIDSLSLPSPLSESLFADSTTSTP